MSAQRIIGLLLLCAGFLYGGYILTDTIRKREQVTKEAGIFPLLCLIEAGIYFAGTLGISDFLLNTLTIQTFHLTDSRKLPGTLVAATLLPGAVISFFLLGTKEPADLATLLPCCISYVAGTIAGVRVVAGMNGKILKKAMILALTGSLAALILRMIISGGAPGTRTGLPLPALVIAVVVVFFLGVINMLGVPAKPASTALFLILGLSPLTVLTLVLVMCGMGPFGGGVEILRNDRYHHKLACAAVIAGSAGAVIGCLVAVSISAGLLNIILICVLLLAIWSLLPSGKRD